MTPSTRKPAWAEREELSDRHALLENAMTELTEREQEIIRARRLRDEPVTLEDLSQKFWHFPQKRDAPD